MEDIVRTDGVLGGEPRLDGTRIGVRHVYELVEGDYPPGDVADQLDLSLGQVYSALAYYHDHPEEMRKVRRAHEEGERRLAEKALSPPDPAK